MKEIEKLILKSFYGTLTSSEQEILDLWLADVNHRKSYMRIRERLLQRNAVSFLAEVDTERALQISYRRRYRRSVGMVAAIVGIAAVVCLIVCLWPAGKSDVSPVERLIVKPYATITLASGEVLQLGKDSLTHRSESEVIEVTDKDISVKGNVPSASVGYNVLSVPRGESYSIKLSDGTKVWVNALSELKFPSSFKDMDERVVELTGEAYFEVASDVAHPFRVKTKQQLITVTGTSFNVNAYVGELSRTTLCEGSVVVRTSKEETVNLVPGQQLAVNSLGEWKMEEVNPQLYTTWIHGIYSFDNQTLEEVFKVLSRWYDIQNIVFESSDEERQLFSGKLRRSDNLETILLVIERGSNRSIGYENGVIEIK